ncbi:cAMP-dependent protein kinase inhibitor gamma [Bombina bombina]|uniref:cAMP-dependent protein kinase inhibitor gamma n=1 Tax=Bombina bombina TaxID=8345 RepID=UPI00235A75A3|nr:cAMP-dependent protein kinase inhibitor gamma [Bombina bombina]
MDIESAYTEFISCDRTGRRNAVPDIKGEGSTTGMRDLSENMGDLAIQGAESQEGASSADSSQEPRPEAQDGSSSS